MNLDTLTLQELVRLKNDIVNRIYSYEDGFLYICKVRSYGRVWTENPKNIYEVQELCYHYNGDEGIVDVYTTNPNLLSPENEFHNYGGSYYIKSQEDYNQWSKHKSTLDYIKSMETHIEEWENRDNVPFNSRPMFKPHITKEELDVYKEEFQNTEWNFTEPVRLKYEN